MTGRLPPISAIPSWLKLKSIWRPARVVVMARKACYSNLLRVLAVFYLICPANIIGLWWAVGSPLAMDKNTICRRSRKLGGRQKEICRKEPEIVQQVARGARMAIEECQFQFRERKWNCSTHRRTINRILKYDTREAGFVHALSSAGVLFAITRACSVGDLEWCPCDMQSRIQWKYAGCGDNVDYGYDKSRDFMDIRKKKKGTDIRTRVRLHNNEAGRLAVRSHMETVCKCHGLSASCSLKTCYRRMPSFREISTRLKDHFDGAVHVSGSNDGRKLVPMGGNSIKPAGKEDIVYTEGSPDFCLMNRRYGSLGTRDRKCDPRSQGTGGCDLLCCDRGHRAYIENEVKHCRCRFRWCCEVECEICNETKQVYRCL